MTLLQVPTNKKSDFDITSNVLTLLLFASEVDEVIEIETKHSKRRSAVNDPGKKKVFRAHPLTVEVCKPVKIQSKIQLFIVINSSF